MAKKRRRQRYKIPRPLLILLLILLPILIFWGFFYVSPEHAEVVGSTRYTSGEVRAMVFDGFLDHNSLYLNYIKKEVHPGSAPFIDVIEIRYKSHNRVQLQVVENAPVGYLVQGDYNYYFDADGFVLEMIPSYQDANGVATIREEAEESVTASSQETPSGNPAEESERTEEEIQEPEPEALTAEAVEAEAEDAELQAVALQTSDTEFHPALTDVTQVVGLTEEEVRVGTLIRVEDPTVFSSIHALTKLISKFGNKPEYIAVDEDSRFTLYYGDIVVKLGRDTLMEEKMSRVNAILPQLEGMKGVLHLENYSEDTVNIVFDRTDVAGVAETRNDSSRQSAETAKPAEVETTDDEQPEDDSVGDESAEYESADDELTEEYE